MSTPWYVYVLTCNDGTLYAGVTTDLERRLAEHNSRSRGAKYTRARQPVRVSHQEVFSDRSSAQVREAAIKKLSRQEKLLLLKS